MTKARVTALVLVMLMLMGLQLPAVAEAERVTAYLTVSSCGEIVTDKNGDAMALAEVELSGKASYTLDDLFTAAHEQYYDGEGGYASDTGDYGLYITKLWGDTSGNFGYQINGGSESVMGLDHEVEDGDYVDAVIYQNYYPDTEGYSTFDRYTARTVIDQEVELSLIYASGYDEEWNTVYSPCEDALITVNGEEIDITTDAEGIAVISFEEEGTYIVSAQKTKTVEEHTVPAITAPVCVVTVSKYPDACITIPREADIFVGQKSGVHFASFTEIEYAAKERDGSVTNYYYDLEDGSAYNYRITHDNYVTYAGKFTKTEDFSLAISEAVLKAGGVQKTDTDRNTASNSGYNVADIYLNINPQGHLKLAANESYQLIPLRSWEAVDSVTGNYFIEPDYSYTVIDTAGKESTDVIEISFDGVITAIGEGTAIVLVTYDALNYADGAGGPFFGAIWPENTGVFVVSAGAGDSGIDTGMTINEGKNPDTIKLSGDRLDAEHDVIYYVGDSGSYTFTPVTEGCSVWVANPTVSDEMTFSGFTGVAANDDGSFTVPLTEGRNIVRVTAGDAEEYQVITAKEVTYTVNGGEPVYPGDTVSIVFDTLYHPANKLAGVYNMNALPVYTNVDGYEGAIIGGLPAQYNFADSENAQTVTNVLKEKNQWGMITYEKDTQLTVPEDLTTDTFTLSGGMLYATGFGDAYGNHRGITLTDGKAPNLTAEARLGWLGRLPDIVIPVEKDAEITQLDIGTEGVKTDYFEGDSFDRENLTVTATYDDGSVITAENYTVSPEVIKENTDKVTISYRGMTEEIAITVTPLKVEGVEVTVPPAKTEYKAGEAFDPTGMVVSVVYNSGKKEVTTDYSYSPKRLLSEDDDEIKIVYDGGDGETVRTPITVSGSVGGGTSNMVKVYFTLLGDTKHGDNGKVHTKMDGNLDTWVEQTAVSIKKDSTVLDVIKKVLGTEGIPYENPTGDYIESIRGLGEFDNGATSGWMYTLNGKYPDKGISEQAIKKGDKIILHYTDDYTVEEDKKSKTSISTGSTSSSTGSVSRVTKQETESTGKEQTKPVYTEDTFDDVNSDDWYASSVEYVYENSMMQGTDKGFEPESLMTRAMLVTVLYRMAGMPEAEKNAEFDDVPEGAWYADAVAWAKQHYIVSGVDSTSFAPDDNITREQMAVIMYRYAVYCGYDVSVGENTNILSYDDFADISDYAVSAMQYAADSGLIQGTGESTLSPKGAATRAQVATILMRFCKNIAK